MSRNSGALRNHYETILRYANDIFLLTDADRRITDANERAVELTGYSRHELLGMHIGQLYAIEKLTDADKQWQFDEQGTMFETEFMRKDGSTFPVEVGARIIEVEGKRFRQAIIRDISERKQSEETLKESEKKYRTIFESAQVGIFRTRASDGKLVMANDAMTKMFGFDSVGEATANFIASEHYVDIGERVKLLDVLRKHGRFDNFEVRMTRNDGVARWFLYSGLFVQNNEYIEGIATDITERKTIEESVRESRDLLRSVVENVPLRIFWKDMELRYLGCNTAFVRDAGMSHPKDLYGKDDSQMGWKDRAELYRADDRKVLESGKPKLGFEEQITTPDGNMAWVRTSKVPLRDANGKVSGLLGIYEDITGRKQAEASLFYLNRALKTLGAVNRALVHSVKEEELWQGVCRAIVEEGGYPIAWVGYAQQDEAKSVKVMASHAVKAGYTDDIRISWDDVPEGHGPTGTALYTSKTQCIQNIAHNPDMQPWREKALAYGYRATIALPLFENGKPFGALTIYASEADAFNTNEVALLEEMAGDLGYGIHMLHVGAERDRSRAEQQHTLEELRDSLENTVRVIASTVEKRDAYTAGHQRRVADLASAIAREMGLPDEQIQGIHFAGIIHDLGKINIPAEILAKPGKINEIEYQLIRSHPQSGYDILKDVAFPWPIADIVLQHHERLDGSGYPQGLKGDRILLEARIMAVADVVEAMSSHRPYRPGLGIEVALQEIEQHKGVRYDSTVVDACVKLFREQAYNLDP